MDIALTLVAIALAIVLILRFKVDPVISLIISSVFLGLSAGVGPADTVAAITTGFGEIMGEVGLLIGFGVLIGSLLQATGTFRALVEIIARRVGRKLPYAMTAALSAIFPSIYVDVQVVLASPMARQAAPVVDRRKGLPWLAGAIGIGVGALIGFWRARIVEMTGMPDDAYAALVTAAKTEAASKAGSAVKLMRRPDRREGAGDRRSSPFRPDAGSGAS